MNPFFTQLLSQSADSAAPDLLGHMLCRKMGTETVRAQIVDVEAYLGEHDKASHARFGKTQRNEVMYGNAGTIYVYLCYGVHNMLNIVVADKDDPQALLIRGIAIDGEKIIGPGKVTKRLGIDRDLNGGVLGKKSGLWFEEKKSAKKKIKRLPRVGVDYAGAWAAKKLRFVLVD